MQTGLSLYAFVIPSSAFCEPVVFPEVGVRVEANLKVALNHVPRDLVSVEQIFAIEAEHLRTPTLGGRGYLLALKADSNLLASKVFILLVVGLHPAVLRFGQHR